MKSIYCKDTPEALAEIRAALEAGEAIEVQNAYTTVYGVGFESWLTKGLADLSPLIESGPASHWEYGYAYDYTVTPV